MGFTLPSRRSDERSPYRGATGVYADFFDYVDDLPPEQLAPLKERGCGG